MVPREMICIDVDIEKSNINVNIKLFELCHMTPIQIHNALDSQNGNREATMFVTVKHLHRVK